MWLKAEQLSTSLAHKLEPIYFISGDEPLQQSETADAVRLAAKSAGFASRELLIADAHFQWKDFLQVANSTSIFSTKKMIDLRLPSGKPGIEGSKALVNYCEQFAKDTLLLITAGKLEKSSKRAKWVTTLEKHGVAIQVWPLEGKDLIQWIEQRMQRKGMNTNKSGLAALASCVEGNLLAANQEIEKLYVLYGQGTLTEQQIQAVVVDTSRYDVFNLVNATLLGRVGRINKILLGVRHEGIAAPIVLWALTREIRTLISIQRQLQTGSSPRHVFMQHYIQDHKRQKRISYALSKNNQQNLINTLLLAAKTDRQIKGEQEGDCWESLLQISLMLAKAV